MMPDEPVRTKLGSMDAYLIEARSIGGVSGSPVFVRETKLVGLGQGVEGPGPLIGYGSFYLLGLMHGHWDLSPESLNDEIVDDETGSASVNMGIAIVTPARKILEVLNHPELIKHRELVTEKRKGQNLPTPDVAT